MRTRLEVRPQDLHEPVTHCSDLTFSGGATGYGWWIHCVKRDFSVGLRPGSVRLVAYWYIYIIKAG